MDTSPRDRFDPRRAPDGAGRDGREAIPAEDVGGSRATTRAADSRSWDYRGEVPDDVAGFLDGLRAEYRQDVQNDVAAGHLRMILAASAETVAQPVAASPWSRRVRKALALGAAKVAITATAAAAATGGGLAVTGNLPDPAQQVVADVVARVGITIPAPDRLDDDTPGDPDDGRPGVGPGGVPALLDDGADEDDVPGKSGDAPGHNKDDDGRPEPRARDVKPEDLDGDDDDDSDDDRGRSDEAPGRLDDRPDDDATDDDDDTTATDDERGDGVRGRSADAPGRAGDVGDDEEPTATAEPRGQKKPETADEPEKPEKPEKADDAGEDTDDD